MKGRPLAVFLLAASFPFITGWAESWDNIRQVMADVHSVKAKFVQKKNLKILAKPLVSTGVFFYRAPENLRWEYTSPVKNVLMVNKNAVRSFMWENGDYVEDVGAGLEATRIVMEQITSWLKGEYEENGVFTADLKAGAPGMSSRSGRPGRPARIELTPAKDFLTEFITRVTLILSDTPGVISVIEISEPHGSSTTLEFTGVSLNASIPDAMFDSVK